MICFCCLLIVGEKRCHLLVSLFVAKASLKLANLRFVQSFLFGASFGKAVCSDNGNWG